MHAWALLSMLVYTHCPYSVYGSVIVCIITPLLFWLNGSIINPLMWRRSRYWSWAAMVKVGILHIAVMIIHLHGGF